MRFAVKRGDLGNRFDVNYHLPLFKTFIGQLKTLPQSVPVSDLMLRWDRGDGPREGFYTDDVTDGVPFIRINNLKDHSVDLSDAMLITRKVHENTLKRTMVGPGSLIFAVTGDLGAASIIPEHVKEANLNSALVRIELDLKRITQKFFCYFFDSSLARKQISFIGKGAAQHNLNVGEIGEVTIPLPSLSAQEHLVAQLDAAREKRAQKLAEANTLLSGIDALVLDTLGLCSPCLTRRGAFGVKLSEARERLDAHFHHPNFHHLQTVLESTSSVVLSEVAEFSNEVWQPSITTSDTFRYIEISGVSLITGTATAEETLVSEAPSRARMQVREGDILISTTRPHHGSIALLEQEFNGCVASTGFAVIRQVNETRISKTYLWSVLRTQLCLRQMLRRSSGGNYPAITQSELEKILIPLPPLEIQTRIVDEVKARRERARSLHNEAESEWNKAKARFEAQLLGEAGLIPRPFFWMV